MVGFMGRNNKIYELIYPQLQYIPNIEIFPAFSIKIIITFTGTGQILEIDFYKFYKRFARIK